MGVLGIEGGFLTGCLIDYSWSKTRQSKNRRKGPMAEFIIMVDCREGRDDKRDSLVYLALGVVAVTWATRQQPLNVNLKGY